MSEHHPPDVDVDDPHAEARAATAVRLFDVRRVIGSLFVLYGVVVTLAGLFDGDAAEAKAGGLDLNLWTGLGMLALGLGFWAWLRIRPPEVTDQPPYR
jgi:hypothetical protein